MFRSRPAAADHDELRVGVLFAHAFLCDANSLQQRLRVRVVLVTEDLVRGDARFPGIRRLFQAMTCQGISCLRSQCTLQLYLTLFT